MSDYGNEPAYPTNPKDDGGLTKLEHFSSLIVQSMIERYGFPNKEELKEVMEQVFDTAQAICDEAERRAK